jgi:hypothetical protein
MLLRVDAAAQTNAKEVLLEFRHLYALLLRGLPDKRGCTDLNPLVRGWSKPLPQIRPALRRGGRITSRTQWYTKQRHKIHSEYLGGFAHEEGPSPSHKFRVPDASCLQVAMCCVVDKNSTWYPSQAIGAFYLQDRLLYVADLASLKIHSGDCLVVFFGMCKTAFSKTTAIPQQRAC